jgi:hypothetical protein
MNRKTRNILWSALLFMLCFPLGNIALIISTPDIPHDKYLLMIFLTGLCIFVLFGLISWIVYYFAKRSNAKDPMKTALIVFSCLILAGILGNSPNLSKAMRERNRYDFLHGFRGTLTKGLEEQFKTNPDVPKEVKDHSKEISDCIYFKFKSNEKLVDEAMNVSDPENFVMTSPDMKRIVEDCINIYLPIK